MKSRSGASPRSFSHKAGVTAGTTRVLPTKHQKRQFQTQQRNNQIYCFVLVGFLVILMIGIGVLTVLGRGKVPRLKAMVRKGHPIGTKAFDEKSESLPRLRDTKVTTAENSVFGALARLEDAMENNLPTNYQINKDWMVPLKRNAPDNVLLTQVQPKVYTPKMSIHGQFFRISRALKQSAWQNEWRQHIAANRPTAPKTDYTDPHLYEYPELLMEPPAFNYPKLRSLDEIFEAWPQDEIDSPPWPIREVLQQFDYTNETELAAAARYRDRKLPFKLIKVPELLEASAKWTDDYVAAQFDGPRPTIQGKCQESPHHFFAFFVPTAWSVEHLGLPPTRNNDYTFAQWADHALYADAVQLSARKPHFYWQAGIPREERELSEQQQWSFVSRDLPSFSSPEPTFISPQPLEQKGIQCRFGERGVTAATHYDAGQNMIGMIQGAKRYILHPPRECHKLGIVTSRHSAFFRHSLLELGKITDRQNNKDRGNTATSDEEERAWLNRAGTSQAVETVLKSGEVLFVPSHWFHYIIGLQKNAQCNVRSGVDLEGDEEFGSANDISPEKCDPRTRQ